MALATLTIVVDARGLTVTTKLAVAVFPDASVVVHETVVTPTANTVPEEGAHTIEGFGSTTSAAVGANVTTAPVADVAGAVMGAGIVRIGGTVSATLNV